MRRRVHSRSFTLDFAKRDAFGKALENRRFKTIEKLYENIKWTCVRFLTTTKFTSTSTRLIKFRAHLLNLFCLGCCSFFFLRLFFIFIFKVVTLFRALVEAWRASKPPTTNARTRLIKTSVRIASRYCLIIWPRWNY